MSWREMISLHYTFQSTWQLSSKSLEKHVHFIAQSQLNTILGRWVTHKAMKQAFIKLTNVPQHTHSAIH